MHAVFERVKCSDKIQFEMNTRASRDMGKSLRQQFLPISSDLTHLSLIGCPHLSSFVPIFTICHHLALIVLICTPIIQGWRVDVQQMVPFIVTLLEGDLKAIFRTCKIHIDL